ncbi:MAG: restriction endonuclease subunit S [Chitinophagaceae bacterium]
MSFSEWKTYKLGEIAQLRKEQVLPKGKEQPYIGLEHIEQQTLRLIGVGSSNDVISNKFQFRKGDILYGKLRPYFRKVYQPKFDGVCSTDIYVIKNKSGIDGKFLFYIAATEDFTQIANSGSTGTRMPRADWNQLKASEWLVPSIKTQEQIGSILSSLDDKIELNRQTNQTLETMAQALFKEWFVNFNFPGSIGKMVDSELGMIPNGWKVGNVGDLFELQRGFDLPTTTRTDGKYPVIAASGFNGFHNEFKINAPGITTGRSGVLGNVFYVQEDFWPLNTSLFIKEFKKATPLFAFHILQRLDLKSLNGGSAVPTLNRNEVHKLVTVIPEQEVIQLFEKIIKPTFELIFSNEKQIQVLTRLRDSLLPRLMKGEIVV